MKNAVSSTLSLNQLYKQAHAWYYELDSEEKDTRDASVQNKVHETICALEECQVLAAQQAVFSCNETMSDMTVEQLQYILIEYYLAVLVQKVTTDRSDPVSRLNLLNRADALYTGFLDRCEQYGIVSKKQAEAHLRQLEDKMDAESLRECKIERFKQERAAKERMKHLMKKTAAVEEDEFHGTIQEQTCVTLQLAILASFNDQLAIRNERDMLQQILALGDLSKDGPDHPSSRAPTSAGIEVTHISSTMEMKRQVIQSGVFQPGYRLPTMSLAEFADREVADALERQEREKNAPEGPKRYEHLERDGLEDDATLVEEAAYRDRAWDDWKDANPKGSGNKKWTQF